MPVRKVALLLIVIGYRSVHNFFIDPSEEWVDWLCWNRCHGGVKPETFKQ